MSSKFARLEEELEKFHFSFPVMTHLENHFATEGKKLRGARIGWHCHLTSITAATVRVLLGAGAKLYMSECNEATTDHDAVDFMKGAGANIFLGSEGPKAVLHERPEIISDTGFVLTEQYIQDLAKTKPYIYAGCEITTSGIQKLREQSSISFPVININDGELKRHVENFHGVGDGAIDALFKVTGRLWTGRKAAVAGYGQVGAGVANYLRRIGAVVHIVETDPTRRLIAHYDGFALIDLPRAIAEMELLITATGQHGLINASDLQNARNGIIFMNVGHWAEELNIKSFKDEALSYSTQAEHLDCYVIKATGGLRQIFVIGSGGPANVVMLTGSSEPTFIHLVTELLSMNYLLEQKAKWAVLPTGENRVPAEVERQASLLALKSLGL